MPTQPTIKTVSSSSHIPPRNVEEVLQVSVNGQLVDGTRAAVSIWDGGLLYGDGIFTTLRMYQGYAIDAPAHHQRLRRQAHLLELPFSLTEEAMNNTLELLAQTNNLHNIDARARITVCRGGSPEDPLPMENLDNIEPTTIITVGALPAPLSQWQLDGIPVKTLGPAFMRGNLPHLKTLNALPTVLALRKAHAAGCPEALILDDKGNIVEGIVSNIFLVIRGRILTPAADNNLLPGRTRGRVISSAAHLGLDLEEKNLPRGYLNSAQEIFMTNSVREIVPVTSVDGKAIGSGMPGPITRRLQDQYRSDINAALGLK